MTRTQQSVIKIGNYTIREQSFEELQRSLEIPISVCGINPYGYFRHVRRFVAELGDQIVGESWTVASRHNPWSKLAHYGIFSAEHKRKGLGACLLDLSLDVVRQAGMEAFFVDTGLSIAHMVYQKHGIHDVVPDHPEWMVLSCDGRPNV